MAVKGSAKSTAVMRWVLIGIVAALGLFLYLRSKNSNAQTQQTAAQSAAAAGDTAAGSNSTNVPTYSLSASGTYDGSYTPYTILNTSPTNMSTTFPAGNSSQPSVTSTSTNDVSSSGITNTQTTTQSQGS